ncbi:hypothetical protein J3R30DRAFT_1681345 [Lentinula aciculospora]|uniref:Uncharacterized protein n=1 Tax=Lentinula aciculospora TaxID=153920 RepID=A0A9W8ZXD3_9AGAR|nr:hypothetical protein J3R30DRAFT_1681345 [Lentinula aciculospora]
MPEADLNNIVRIRFYQELFQDVGIDVKQVDIETKPAGFSLLESPQDEFGDGVKGLGLSNSTFFTNIIQDCRRPKQDRDADDAKTQRKKEEPSKQLKEKELDGDVSTSSCAPVKSRTKQERSRLYETSKGSQESKFSQQLHTPRTSSFYSSPSPQSVSFSNWSPSDRGSPYTHEKIEENEEDESNSNSSSTNPSPTPPQRQKLSYTRRTEISTPASSANEGICNSSPIPAPPTPAQRPKPPPTQSTVYPPSASNDNIVEMPSFDLNSTQPAKSEFISPIQSLKSTSVPRLPRIPPAMPPPWLEHVKDGDTSFVQQLIPESSQFRPSSPTPAQRRRPEPKTSYTPNRSRMPFSQSDPSGVKHSPIPSLSFFPLGTNKLTSAATAPSSLMRTRFQVQRRVPPPPPPPPMDSQRSPKVLAPNSDTSGTQSQSQHNSQSQSQHKTSLEQCSELHFQSLGKQSDSEHASRTEDDSQLINVDAKQHPPSASQRNIRREFSVSDDDDNDHDPLFSGPDDDIAIYDHISNPARHVRLLPLNQEHRHYPIAENDTVVTASLGVHTGNSLLEDKSLETPPGFCATQRPLCFSTASLAIEAAADTIDNMCGDILGSADGIHEFSSRIGSPSLDSQRSKKTVEDCSVALESPAHDIEAWCLPTFLRHKRTENMKAEVQPVAKAFREGKQKARLAGSVVGETSRAPFLRTSEKRSHTEQYDNSPSKKKQKTMPEGQAVSSKKLTEDQETFTTMRKLDSFDPGFDDVPPGETFMSWERLQTIALKVGRTRTRQAQTG